MFSFSKLTITLLSLSLAISIMSCSEEVDVKQLNLKKLQQQWNWQGKVWNERELKVLDAGKKLYNKNCAKCHLKSGMGDNIRRAPILRKNDLVNGNPKNSIKVLLFGRSNMPAYGAALSNQQLASITSYMRNAWGNRVGDIITQQQVQNYRQFNLAIAQQKWNWKGKKWREAELRLLEEGEKNFIEICSGCHLENGSGFKDVGAPGLRGKALLRGNPSSHITTVLFGKKIMPPYAKSLSNEVIASIISYEINAWGNNAGISVKPAQIKALRSKSVRTRASKKI